MILDSPKKMRRGSKSKLDHFFLQPEKNSILIILVVVVLLSVADVLLLALVGVRLHVVPQRAEEVSALLLQQRLGRDAVVLVGLLLPASRSQVVLLHEELESEETVEH